MLLDNTVALVSVLAILLNSAGWLLEERTGSATVQAQGPLGGPAVTCPLQGAP